jgi:hypothetical protein
MPEPERYFWTQEDIKTLPTLPEPVETFDLATNESRVLRIIRWGLYQHLIHPRWAGGPAEKLTISLRVWMAPGYESQRAPYWDIHQGHLISLLYPFLQKPDYKDFEVIVTKRGEAPKAYFEVEFKKPV